MKNFKALVLYALLLSLVCLALYCFFKGRGISAEPAFVAASPAGKGAMAPRFSMAGQALYMTWLEPDDVGERDSQDALWHIRWARWLVQEQSWSDARTIHSARNLFVNWADAPSLIALNDNEFYAHWLAKNRSNSPYAYDIQLAHSVDGGVNWRALGRVDKARAPRRHSYDGFLSFLPMQGGARMFWISARGGNSAIDEDGATTKPRMTIQTSVLGGESEARTVLELDGDVCSCCTTTAIQSSAGAMFFYRNHTAEEIRDMYYVRQQDGQWQAPQVLKNEGWNISGCPVNGAKAASDEERVAVAWYSAAGGKPQVRLVWSLDGGEHFAESVDIDGISPAGPVGRVGLVLAPRREAIVSWIAQLGSKNTASLLLRRVGEDGALSDYFTVGEVGAGRSAGIPQLALVGKYLFVAWTQDSGIVLTRVVLASVPLLAD